MSGVRWMPVVLSTASVVHAAAGAENAFCMQMPFLADCRPAPATPAYLEHKCSSSAKRPASPSLAAPILSMARQMSAGLQSSGTQCQKVEVCAAGRHQARDASVCRSGARWKRHLEAGRRGRHHQEWRGESLELYSNSLASTHKAKGTGVLLGCFLKAAHERALLAPPGVCLLAC